MSLNYETFRELINKRIEQLSGLQSPTISSSELLGGSRSFEDVPQLDLAAGVNAGVRSNRVAELNALDRALQRIKQGNYGICVSCGNPISEARLLAKPEATDCRDCHEVRGIDEQNHGKKRFFAPPARLRGVNRAHK